MIEKPGGYQREHWACFGAGTLDSEGRPLPPPCSVTGEHDYMIFVDYDAVRCRTCERTMSQKEYVKMKAKR